MIIGDAELLSSTHQVLTQYILVPHAAAAYSLLLTLEVLITRCASLPMGSGTCCNCTATTKAAPCSACLLPQWGVSKLHKVHNRSGMPFTDSPRFSHMCMQTKGLRQGGAASITAGSSNVYSIFEQCSAVLTSVERAGKRTSKVYCKGWATAQGAQGQVRHACLVQGLHLQQERTRPSQSVKAQREAVHRLAAERKFGPGLIHVQRCVRIASHEHGHEHLQERHAAMSAGRATVMPLADFKRARQLLCSKRY